MTSHAPCRYANRLRKHRRLMRLNQKEVAEKLGLKSSDRISRWERGISAPSIINLFKLSILYHTLADQLYIDLVEDLRDEVLGDDHNNHYEKPDK